MRESAGRKRLVRNVMYADSGPTVNEYLHQHADLILSLIAKVHNTPHTSVRDVDTQCERGTLYEDGDGLQ